MLAALGTGTLASAADADIAFRSAGQAANGTAASLTIPRPAAVAAGDVLIATVDARGFPEVTAPSGWTLIRRDVSTTTQRKASFYRLATAGEPASYTFALDQTQPAAGAIVAYAGVDATAPVDAAAGQVNASWGSALQTAPSVTTSGAAVVLALWGSSNAASATPPAGMVERADVAETAGAFDVDSAVADTVRTAAGATGTFTATASTTGASIGHTIALRPAAAPSGPSLFAPNSFWNVPIPSSPALDPNSADMVRALNATGKFEHMANSQRWGIPIVQATTSDPLYSMTSRTWPAGPEPVDCRVPLTAAPNLGSDGHLSVLQPDGSACDFWTFSRLSDGTPQAGTVARTCGRVTGPNRDAWGTIACRGSLGGGATAAGFALAGGLLRPEEFDGSAPIPHALAIVLPDEVVREAPAWPATHSDGACRLGTCIPEGARLQFDPAFDVDAQTWPAWKKKLARAMQTYGAYVVDQGGSIAFRAEERADDAVWTGRGIPINDWLGGASGLPWGGLRVLETTAAPSTIPSWWTGG